MMRMLVDGFLGRAASQGSPGVDEVRWLKPVRPGEAVRLRFTPLEKRVLGSRPDVGITKVLVELIDGRDQVLANWLTNQLTRLRTPDPAPAQSSAPKAARNPIASLWDDAAVVAQAYPDLPFEDRQIGETTDVGSHTFSRDDIVGFASQFDPQPFHLDEAAAKASLFGGLCASGWQTAAFLIRGIITTRQQASAAARAQGVRAGDLRAVARLPQSALAEAGVRRRHHRVPHAPRRQGRPEVAPRARPAGERGAGPQPARRGRVRHHHADAGRAAQALDFSSEGLARATRLRLGRFGYHSQGTGRRARPRRVSVTRSRVAQPGRQGSMRCPPRGDG